MQSTNGLEIETAGFSGRRTLDSAQAQFLRIEGYALSASKLGDKRSVSDVIQEALRIPSDCAHVPTPKPPVFLHGDLEALNRLPQLLTTGAQDAKQMSKGGAHIQQRKDTPVLLAGVVCHPDAPVPYSQELEAWARDTVTWLIEKYGPRLDAVIAHFDEPHFHLHFFVSCQGHSIKRIHCGYAAVSALGRDAEPKLRRRAYSNAMREFQNDYFEAVAVKHGLDRIGPARGRMTPEESMRERMRAQALKLALERATEVDRETEEKEEQAKRNRASAEQELASALARARDLQAQNKKISDRLTEWAAQLQHAQAVNDRREAALARREEEIKNKLAFIEKMIESMSSDARAAEIADIKLSR